MGVIIETTKEKALEDYISLRTQNTLSKLEFQVLLQVTKYGLVGKGERVAIRETLRISPFSLNNMLGSLKKKGYIEKEKTGTAYRCSFEIPGTIRELTFEFKIK